MPEFLTSNIYRAYPFVDDAAGICFDKTNIVYNNGGDSCLLPGVFVDALILPTSPVEYLFLSKIKYNLDFPFIWECEIIDDQNNIYNVSINVYSANTFTVAHATALNSVFKFVVHTETALNYILMCPLLPDANNFITISFNSRALLFSTNTIVPQIKSITRLTLKNGKNFITELDHGDITLKAGYNAVFTFPAEKQIQFNAVSGAGAGLAPCDQVFLGSTLHGNIILDGDPCISIATDVKNNKIYLFDVCKECCSCQEYAAVANQILSLQQRIEQYKQNFLQITNKVNAVTSYLNNTINYQICSPVWDGIARGGYNKFKLFLETDDVYHNAVNVTAENIVFVIVLVKNPRPYAGPGLIYCEIIPNNITFNVSVPNELIPPLIYEVHKTKYTNYKLSSNVSTNVYKISPGQSLSSISSVNIPEVGLYFVLFAKIKLNIQPDVSLPNSINIDVTLNCVANTKKDNQILQSKNITESKTFSVKLK